MWCEKNIPCELPVVLGVSPFAVSAEDLAALDDEITPLRLSRPGVVVLGTDFVARHVVA